MPETKVIQIQVVKTGEASHRIYCLYDDGAVFSLDVNLSAIATYLGTSQRRWEQLDTPDLFRGGKCSPQLSPDQLV